MRRCQTPLDAGFELAVFGLSGAIPLIRSDTSASKLARGSPNRLRCAVSPSLVSVPSFVSVGEWHPPFMRENEVAPTFGMVI